MKLKQNTVELYLTFLGSVERIVFVHIMCDSLVLPALIVMNAGLFINAEQPVLAVCIATIKYTHRTGLSFSLVGLRGNTLVTPPSFWCLRIVSRGAGSCSSTCPLQQTLWILREEVQGDW